MTYVVTLEELVLRSYAVEADDEVEAFEKAMFDECPVLQERVLDVYHESPLIQTSEEWEASKEIDK